jgi:serine/threonine protein kinase
MAVAVAVPYGKYMLDRKLTEGGMAEIYLARPNPALAPPRIAARPSPIIVKRLFAHHSSEAEFVRMFMNEAKLATKLKHPNIVDIFDQGESDGTYYLAMEFIHGEDLRGIAQQADAVHKRPPMAIVVRIIIDTLAGLHYAHTLVDDDGSPLGLVHRDVSPQNVLVTYEGVTKIIDFGIAKATRARDMDQTQAGMIKGKYAYMSPEQTRSDQLDARSDVFSVGTLLWELLTWRRLFRRATDLATLVAVTEEPAPPAATVNPEVPKELDDILMRSLSMDREQRWDSAKDFHDALLDYVERAGWDASGHALGRYMKEIFADKLSRERREREREAAFAASMAASASVPSAVEDRLSSGMPMRNMSGRVPGPPPPPGQSAEGGPRRAMTMPLQVISASQIQQRKAMVVPKSGGRDTSQTGLPPVPPVPGEAASRSSMPSRMSKPPPPPPPRGSASGIHAPPSATSMPMRIIPDGASSFAGGGEGQQEAAGVAAAGHSGAAVAPVPSVPILAPVSPVDPGLSSGLGLPRLDQPVPPAIKPAAMAAANLQPMHGMPPAMSGAGQSNQSAAVIQPVGLASQTITTPPARANRASVIIAIVLGVLIGVIAVLLMQLLVLSH